MSKVLDARGLVKAFHRSRSKEITRAVQGVDLAVERGERVALLGPNGAGKTTTLLMILGAITPDEGSVFVNGIDARKHRREAALQIGFTAGYIGLPSRVRVWEYLRIYSELYGQRAEKTKLVEMLAYFQVAQLADVYCTELSSGQKTLISVIKSTVHNPALLVLDEPTAYLDPDVAQRVRLGLLRMNDERQTSLLVTSHNMVEVDRLCERIVFISHGRVVANGTTQEVTAQFGHNELEDVFVHLAEQQGLHDQPAFEQEVMPEPTLSEEQ